jgi:hypothetical protein
MGQQTLWLLRDSLEGIQRHASPETARKRGPTVFPNIAASRRTFKRIYSATAPKFETATPVGHN